MTASSAHLALRPDGSMQVDSSLRLSGSSHVLCCTYPDRPPILALDDAHVHVSVTVPDPEHVTADDLAIARDLASAVSRYVTELEHHHASRAREREAA
jgi:hypothetical protein